MMRKPCILFFDSGLGGLSIVRACRQHLPAFDAFYLADRQAFPYGDQEPDILKERIVSLIERANNSLKPNLIIIACNTASTLALDGLRKVIERPIIGTVPALKPAAEKTKTGLISVIATPSTAKGNYLRQLGAHYAPHCDVTYFGAPNLAHMAEHYLLTKEIDLKALRAEIQSIFIEREGGKTDHIVLGCTHYPLLIEALRQVALWDVDWVDSSHAIAKRALSLMNDVHDRGFDYQPSRFVNSFLSTSLDVEQKSLLSTLKSFGLEKCIHLHEMFDIEQLNS